MGEGWALVVSCLDCFWAFTSLAAQAGFFMHFIAVNGNFKLKGKERNLKDVELMPGWGAYVPEDKYQKHLANYVDEPEVSPNNSVGEN